MRTFFARTLRINAVPGFFCALIILAVAPAPSAAAEAAVRQAISAEVEQRVGLQEPREDELGLSDWWLELQADAAWRVDLGDRLSVSVSPRVEWRENGGTADGLDFSESEGRKGEGEASLWRAEAALSLGEWGVELLAGKLRPQFGVNYVEPLSVMNLRGRDSYDEGLWLSGVLLAAGAFTLEAYGQADSNPTIFSALSALVDIHEIGVLYRRERGEGNSACGFLGAWFRTQIGDGLIPYGELALRNDSAFLDLDGLEARDVGRNWEALAGLGWSPGGVNLSAYLEYRYRQAGYDEDDWERIDALGVRAAGAYLPDFPYLQTSVHAVGLHLQNQDEALGFLTWSASCIYLLPDGLYTQALLEAGFIERCRVGLKAELATSPGKNSGSPRSEPALWPHEGRLTLYVNWKINANEDAPHAL